MGGQQAGAEGDLQGEDAADNEQISPTGPSVCTDEDRVNHREDLMENNSRYWNGQMYERYKQLRATASQVSECRSSYPPLGS